MFGYFIFLVLFASLRLLLVYFIHEKYQEDLEKEEQEKFKILINNILRDNKKLNILCNELQICEWRLRSWAITAPPKIVMMQVLNWLRKK